jgi:hypothetical protein
MLFTPDSHRYAIHRLPMLCYVYQCWVCYVTSNELATIAHERSSIHRIVLMNTIYLVTHHTHDPAIWGNTNVLFRCDASLASSGDYASR